MLTPILEDLILKGRAFFRTAVIGGTQKATINIDEDRFIIITDLTYFPGYYKENSDIFPNKETDYSSQFTIYGERGFCNFIARTSFDSFPFGDLGNYYTPKNHIRYDTYILHTTQVGFSFSKGSFVSAGSFPAPADNPGYAPPLDYGRVGDTGVINTSPTTTINTATGAFYNATTRAGSGTTNYTGFQFPFDVNTQINAAELEYTNNYPILQVNYIEVLGLPNNLGI
jgi:hypothetical protein